MSEKLVKQNTIEASGNQLHNTTRGFDLCSVISHPYPISRSHTGTGNTHSAFSDTYRAFTIIGKEGSLGWNTQFLCIPTIPGCKYLPAITQNLTIAVV